MTEEQVSWIFSREFFLKSDPCGHVEKPFNIVLSVAAGWLLQIQLMINKQKS